jgi:hypothetical protein
MQVMVLEKIMKVYEILEEGFFDRFKSMLGSVKGKILSSVTSLLNVFKKNPNAQLTTIGKFSISKLHLNDVISRVDTGATTCSIHATEIEISEDQKEVTFKCDGGIFTLPLFKIQEVKSASGISKRPKVKLDFTWNEKQYSGIEVNLADRSKLKFKMLIGRNLIAELKVPVYIDPNDDTGDA